MWQINWVTKILAQFQECKSHVQSHNPIDLFQCVECLAQLSSNRRVQSTISTITHFCHWWNTNGNTSKQLFYIKEERGWLQWEQTTDKNNTIIVGIVRFESCTNLVKAMLMVPMEICSLFIHLFCSQPHMVCIGYYIAIVRYESNVMGSSSISSYCFTCCKSIVQLFWKLSAPGITHRTAHESQRDWLMPIWFKQKCLTWKCMYKCMLLAVS